MVLPILILITFTLMLVMIHFYTYHQGQIRIHKEMIFWSQESDAVFHIQKKELNHQTELEGIVKFLLQREAQYRIYALEATDWIRLGEMAGFSDE